MPNLPSETVYVGGWFQRTTLHLSEIYDFLKEGSSPLKLNESKLKSLREGIQVKTFEMKVDHLEYIQIDTVNDITVKIYEDGLIVIKRHLRNRRALRKNIGLVTKYYEDKLSPAISYLFSLGAPIPKKLANIETIYPYFIVLNNVEKDYVNKLLSDFGQTQYYNQVSDTFEIYRGNKLYILNNMREKPRLLERFIEETIFFREFKGQLHKYLNLHRYIWEEIAEIKEKGEIKGSDIGESKQKVESYQKTINLISTRIDQMSTYVGTRESILKNDETLGKISGMMEYKHETLRDTLSYLKDIWSMTQNYVDSAIQLFSEVQAKATNSSVTNLTIVTSVGVGATLLGLFTKTQLPAFTLTGVGYFAILLVIGISANKIMKKISEKRIYKIKDTEINTKIGE